MPPFSFISPNMPAASRVIITKLPIESIPFPMKLNRSSKECPSATAMIRAETMPPVRTIVTFMPARAVPITIR